jgi:hypothetical protein
MRFNAHLDASDHGPPQPFRDAAVVADSVTGTHVAMVKHLFVDSGCDRSSNSGELNNIPRMTLGIALKTLGF